MTGDHGRKARPSPAGDCCQILAPPAFLPAAMYRGFSYMYSSKALLLHFLVRTIKVLTDFFFFFFNV